MVEAYTTSDALRFASAGKHFVEIIEDLEELLCTHTAFLLGNWLAQARSWAIDPAEAGLYEWNARNLITLWGKRNSKLHDYSCRLWAGLVGDFYLVRWKKLIEQAQSTIGTPWAEVEFGKTISCWEEEWTKKMRHSRPQPKVTLRPFRGAYLSSMSLS